jgi:phenylalanyl-tRNA synthetase beta chain
MAMLNIPLSTAVKAKSLQKCYSIKESSLPTFFPGRCADILYDGKKIGSFGIVHPEVLRKFDITYPCSCLEMTIEQFV